MPERVQLSRAKGWRMPPNTVKVDRSTMLGNPWHVGAPGQLDTSFGRLLLPRPMTAAEAVAQHRAWLAGRPIPAQSYPANVTRVGRRAIRDELAARRVFVLGRLPHLRGQNLACWCGLDAPCHADVLLDLANA